MTAALAVSRFPIAFAIQSGCGASSHMRGKGGTGRASAGNSEWVLVYLLNSTLSHIHRGARRCVSRALSQSGRMAAASELLLSPCVLEAHQQGFAAGVVAFSNGGSLYLHDAQYVP